MDAFLFTGSTSSSVPLMFGVSLELTNKNGWKDGHVYQSYIQFEQLSTEKTFDNVVCTMIYNQTDSTVNATIGSSCGKQ